jgi:hypothetical protein
MENGTLGESMCSTLLLQRFWVMKRSVDTDGGDFLIQIRDSSAKFTDMLPPRIGTVQSKFSQDKKTTHYVNKDYVVDPSGEPLRGFFLVIHVGAGDHPHRYILTASEISENLSVTIKEGNPYYLIGADAYVPRYKMASAEVALDKIEGDLLRRSDEDKRRFLQSVLIPDYDLKRRNLDYTWLLPIPNEHAYIPDEIYWIKSSLRLALYAYDDVQKMIGELLFSQDAKECASLIDQLRNSQDIYERDGAHFLRPNSMDLRLSPRLGVAVDTHARRLKLLEDSGHLKHFIGLMKSLFELCVKSFEKLKPTKVKMSENSFTFKSIKISIGVKFEESSRAPLSVNLIHGRRISNSTDSVIYDISESGQVFTNWEDGKVGGWRDMHRLQDRIMARYFSYLFPDEPIGNVKQAMLMME